MFKTLLKKIRKIFKRMKKKNPSQDVEDRIRQSSYVTREERDQREKDRQELVRQGLIRIIK